MAFGRRKPKEQQPVDEADAAGTRRSTEPAVESPAVDDLDGPFDIEDFDDVSDRHRGPS